MKWVYTELQYVWVGADGHTEILTNWELPLTAYKQLVIFNYKLQKKHIAYF